AVWLTPGERVHGIRHGLARCPAMYLGPDGVIAGGYQPGASLPTGRLGPAHVRSSSGICAAVARPSIDTLVPARRGRRCSESGGAVRSARLVLRDDRYIGGPPGADASPRGGRSLGYLDVPPRPPAVADRRSSERGGKRDQVDHRRAWS